MPRWIDVRLPGARAVFTTRVGGVSVAPYDSLNLATHVGDDPLAVGTNRERLMTSCGMPRTPFWLEQVHGRDVVAAHEPATSVADGSWTDRPGFVCAVMVADCLPVLLSDGEWIAAVHCGWRGLSVGILQEALQLQGGQRPVSAWLGPCISQSNFELGPEVRDEMLEAQPHWECHFAPGQGDRWHGDLQGMAESQLRALGVDSIAKEAVCTVANPDLYYSYRRDGACGRMAALIWRDPAE